MAIARRAKLLLLAAPFRAVSVTPVLVMAVLVAAVLIAGCKDFWQTPSGSSNFTLSNSGNITMAPGATTGNTSSITITPSNSFTGTVALTCSVTSSPSGATSPATCSLSPTSVTISSTTAQTSTLTATTTSSTTTGAYQVTVTGTSGSTTQTTNLCVEVTSSSGTCSASSGTSGNSSGVFYVVNQQTKQIVGYSISSGSLTKVSGSPYTLSAAPYSIAIAPSGGFLYVGTAAGIFLYSIGSGGALTLANNNNVISQDIATTMQVDSTNSWLVEAGPNLAEVLAIRINSSTGVPNSGVEQFALLPSVSVQQLTISPDNQHVFVADGSSGTENIFFSAGNSDPFGSESNISVINGSGAALSVAVDPSSRLFYIGETVATSGSNTGGLRVFNYSSMTEITGSPFASGGLAPVAIAPTLYGTNADDYVYVANRTVSGSSTGNVAGFSVTTSGSTTSLAALGSTASVGTTPVGLVQDSTGAYMLVINSGGNPDLQAFTFDSTTAGKLDSQLTSNTGTDPVLASAIAALP